MMARQQELQLELPAGSAAPAAPGAQYSLQLGDQPLPFRLRRSRRPNVAFSVDERGLQVSAPRGMTLPRIEQAIRDGSRAIVGKLDKAAASGKLPLPRRWHDGVRFPFLGRGIVLRLDAATDSAVLRDDALHLPLPPQAADSQVKDRAHGWLQAEARRVLGEHVTACAQRLGIAAPQWRLSFAAGSWGGVGADGRLRLSWRLIHLTPEEMEGVILRQLAPLQWRAEVRDLWDAAPLSA
ncbi:MAG: metal-dependent hydrolase [Rhodocyclaceae bacterium]|jgi:predicted metal-dependent hydrolase|nr:metal-dependent hydrolase [Rhodocyclaceae bacterium]